ncbi:hypothetical protein [Cellulomonas chitinilytica]|uniref:hypothetical protein n=1 Tax=Cellulomonas chitinilytica TaxID=398759 RepID=UPI00194322AD|nr:hypothetical protein [Cellulomonas chitinilytica]
MPTGANRPRREQAAVAVVAAVALGLLATTAVRAVALERPDPPPVSRGDVQPGLPPAPRAATSPFQGSSPYTAMWLWDNPVHVTHDARGRDFVDADPPTVAAFAHEHGVSTVYVAAPWASDEGPVAAWVDDMVVVLRGEGVDVALLGGDATWLGDPSLGARWVRDALHGRGVDRVQLSLEPWALPLWQTDRDRAVAQWDAATDAVRAALPDGVALGVDAPYWLAGVPDGRGATLFDHVLSRADSVALITYRDTALGDEGVLALSADARRAAGDAGVPYTIGLETDSPLVAGGPEHTFFDDGVLALDSQARLVDEALRGDDAYRGIAVERYRTWRHLAEVAAGTLVR